MRVGKTLMQTLASQLSSTLMQLLFSFDRGTRVEKTLMETLACRSSWSTLIDSHQLPLVWDILHKILYYKLGRSEDLALWGGKGWLLSREYICTMRYEGKPERECCLEKIWILKSSESPEFGNAASSTVPRYIWVRTGEYARSRVRRWQARSQT